MATRFLPNVDDVHMVDLSELFNWDPNGHPNWDPNCSIEIKFQKRPSNTSTLFRSECSCTAVVLWKALSYDKKAARGRPRGCTPPSGASSAGPARRCRRSGGPWSRPAVPLFSSSFFFFFQSWRFLSNDLRDDVSCRVISANRWAKKQKIINWETESQHYM